MYKNIENTLNDYNFEDYYENDYKDWEGSEQIAPDTHDDYPALQQKLLNRINAHFNTKSEKQLPDYSYEDDILPRRPSLVIGDISVVSGSTEQSTPTCGTITTGYPKSRIVNGKIAAEGSHPWVVSLALYGDDLCTAVIIDKGWVLTAAHCVKEPNDPSFYKILVGSHNRQRGTTYRVTQLFSHPKYNKLGFKEYDIALLKIKGPIVMTKNIQPICLPDPYAEPRDDGIVVAGWGSLSYLTGVEPHLLQEVKLDIIAIEECAQSYDKLDFKVFRSQLCTYTRGRDTCKGDSGSPGEQYINGRAVLVGVVSYGVRCAGPYPGVFTKVSYQINWIQETMAKH